MKKFLGIISILVVSSFLAGCTSSQSYNFDQKNINTTPHWEIDKVKLDSWGTISDGGTEVDAQDFDRVQTDPSVASTEDSIEENSNKAEDADVASYNYVFLTNKKNGCTLEGRISYSPSYQQAWGDLFNSKYYLYNMVDVSQEQIKDESIVDIDGNSYVLGYFTAPESRGENIYHKTAVRVFSTPVNIQGTTGFSDDEVGNHKADLNTGLPTVVIDMSCSNIVDINEDQWSAALKNLKLSFEPLPAVAKE